MNKEQELKEEIEKCKDRVKTLGNNQVSDKSMKEFLIEKNNYDKLQAELKGYQEAQEEFRNKLKQLKKEEKKKNINNSQGYSNSRGYFRALEDVKKIEEK